MKKLFFAIVFVLTSVVLFAQTPTNYKEGDFTGKELQSKTFTLDNNWNLSKTSAGVLTWKYNRTSIATLSTAGLLSTTSVTATNANITQLTIPASDTTATAAVGKIVLKGTTLYVCVSTSAARKWHAITATAN